MNNVIEFPESCSYTNTNGVLGVINDSAGVELAFDGNTPILITESKITGFKNRKELAEFLWMCVRLVDSEGRWEKSEYAGMNYPEDLQTR